MTLNQKVVRFSLDPLPRSSSLRDQWLKILERKKACKTALYGKQKRGKIRGVNVQLKRAHKTYLTFQL